MKLWTFNRNLNQILYSIPCIHIFWPKTLIFICGST